MLEWWSNKIVQIRNFEGNCKTFFETGSDQTFEEIFKKSKNFMTLPAKLSILSLKIFTDNIPH